jgi:hypothetical protein
MARVMTISSGFFWVLLGRDVSVSRGCCGKTRAYMADTPVFDGERCEKTEASLCVAMATVVFTIPSQSLQLQATDGVLYRGQ